MAESFLQNAQLTGLDRQARRTEILRAKQGAALDARVVTLEGLSDSQQFVDFTPSFNNLTVGSGSSSGRYCYINPTLMYVEFHFQYGSGSSVGSGPSLTIPNGEVTASTIEGNAFVGQCAFNDAGTTTFYGSLRVSASSSTLLFMALGLSGSYLARTGVASTIPMTWTTNDALDGWALVPLTA